MNEKPGSAPSHRSPIAVGQNGSARDAPGALEDLGQQQHRHVAADAVALAGDPAQLGDHASLQRGWRS